MHDSARPHGTLNRRRFLSLSSQSLLALSLSQLIPVNLLAEERQAELPDGLLRMGRDIFPTISSAIATTYSPCSTWRNRSRR